MQRPSILNGMLRFCMASLLPVLCFGQDTSQPADNPPAPSSASSSLPRFGIQATVGSLGAGVQAATAVTSRSNVRVGFNYFSYSGSTNSDNINYNGTLRLTSVEALYDQYLGFGFHVSPGLAIYDGNRGTGNASIPAGQTFTLNSVSYFSATADPVHGTASITARKVAPEILIGFGNLLPRSARHFTLNVEAGVIFQGSPNAKLNLTGSTCPSGPTVGCLPIGSNPSVQSNVQAEQSKINNDLGPFKYYPVIRMGFGYKF